MHPRFASLLDQAHDKLEALLAMPPVTYATLPKVMPAAGIYLLSEGSNHLYAGRSNRIRKRLAGHCRPGATHRTAAFAFILARKGTKNLQASYKAGAGSREGLMQNPNFREAFSKAKDEIRSMDIRFVEEIDPTKQALLEIYVAVSLQTPHNDFDTH